MSDDRKRPGKKIATWHNDGTPGGRWEWESEEGAPRLLWLIPPFLFVVVPCLIIYWFLG